ncbi:MAG: F0F1 ATP synthase subunit B [Rhodothermales bacterium]|nr:F0F1 ATP synthase subunit B [Rhodothermales bacterium]
MNPILAVNLLSPNFGLFFWMTVTFLLLLFVLRKIAWGPITKALIEREEKIDASIKSAENALAEAKKIQADNAKARREADQDAQRILREARDASEQLRAEEVDKTRSKIQAMQEQARVEIEREKESALNELRAEVADLAIQAAEKILDDSLDQNRQKRLVASFIDGLGRN